MAGIVNIRRKGNELVVMCPKNMKVNKRELEILKSGDVPALICPVTVQKGNRYMFYYDITGYMPLVEYISKQIKKEDFIRIVLNLPELLEALEKKYMQKQNLVLNVGNIYFNSKTNRFKYIYMPLINADRQDESYEFLRKLPYYMVFSPVEKNDYIMRYINFFKDTITFSIYDFLTLIEKLRSGQEESISFNTIKNDHKNEAVQKMCGYLVDLSTGEKISIDRDSFMIGKNYDCSHIINDVHISRHHAKIELKASSYYLTDMGSTNHTYINDIEIARNVPVELHNGMKLNFADKSYRFFLKKGAAVL